MGVIMDDFYYEENSSKHVFIKILIILFIIGICIGIFLYYKNENTIKLKKITVELGTELSLNVDDYLINGKKNSKDYKLDLSNVDINKVGTYTYKVKYNKHTKIGTIVVKDTIKPNVTTEDIVIGINEDFDPSMLILSCDDLSLPCSVQLKDNKILDKLKNVGTYNVDIIVSDAYGNSVNKSAVVKVSETETLSNKKSNDLEYYNNNANDDTIEHVFFLKLDKAIEEDSKEFKEIYNEVAETDFEDYTDGEIYNTKLILAYNRYGYVIGIQVLVTYYDGTTKLLENR